MITWLLWFALLLFSILYSLGHFRPKKQLRLPPGPWGLPLVGNALSCMGRPFHTYVKWQRDHGDIFMVKFGPIRVMVLGSVKLIKECFQDPVFNGRPSEWSALILTRGRVGILTTDGPVWSEQRRFTVRTLRNVGLGKTSMGPLVLREVEEVLDWLQANTGNKSIDLRDKFELAMANCLWGILASERYSHDDPEKLDILRNLYKTFGQPTATAIALLVAPSLLQIFPGILGYSAAVKLAEDFRKMLEPQVRHHMKNPPEDGVPRDFIDAYLQQIKETTDEDSSFYQQAGFNSLLSTISEFFFGTTETKTLTLLWAILYLAAHPDAQRTLQEEIDTVVTSTRLVTLEDKPRMPFAEATVLEVLRLSSIVSTGIMHRCMEDTTFHGYDLPKNTWIMPNLYAIHHDPNIWEDPQNFRPERFLSPDGQSVVNNPNLIPFSAGKRNCIGETLAKDEIFLFMINIFHRFRIYPDPTQPTPDLEPQKGFLLQPKPFKVHVESRTSL